MQPDKNGFFGQYGGAYVPEILYKCVHDLQDQYQQILDSKEFQDEYYALLKDYVGALTALLCQAHEREIRLPSLSQA